MALAMPLRASEGAPGAIRPTTQMITLLAAAHTSIHRQPVPPTCTPRAPHSRSNQMLSIMSHWRAGSVSRMPSGGSRPRDRKREFGRRVEEGTVTRDENELRIAQSLGTGKMHGVVAAERELLGEVAGPSDQALVHVQAVDLRVQGVGILCEPRQLARRDPAHPLRLSECSPSFGIDEPNGDEVIGLVPEPSGSFGARLLEKQWDEGGRIEVCDHRR